MNREQSENSRNVTIQRRIDRLKASISEVEAVLFTTGANDAQLQRLEHDAERLVKYLEHCRVVNNSDPAKDYF